MESAWRLILVYKEGLKACKSKYIPFSSNQSVICNKWSYTNKSQQNSTPIYPKPKQNI
jgi:hypothetical protein